MTELWDPAIADNPEAFVLFAFPWGKENTPLHNQKGPKTWQRDELQKIAAVIKDNKERMAKGLTPRVDQSATASGRGPGKSALCSWLTLWMLSTKLGSSTIVTANTEPQLKTKTWAELGKWHTLLINSHWFDKQALSLKPQDWFRKVLKEQLKIDDTYYYAQALLWSEENPDAFAGSHNLNGMLLIMDEASGIHEKIWTVSEGFFTDPVLYRFWYTFSNPRRNTGAFFDCFHKHRDYWRTRNIDSRTVEGTDVEKLNQIVQKYGEDSDEARIEVKGQFPRQGDNQFISRELVDAALLAKLDEDNGAPLIMGVDPARFGSDKTVIRFRQGRNARVIPPVKLKHANNMEVANHCAGLISKYNPDAVCIDAGNGTGIIDRLREMGYRVHEVWFGSKSADKQYADKRTEIWGLMRDWLRSGAMIDNDQDLVADLVSPEYRYSKNEAIRLESKEDLKKRGFHSPDDADALACTFAVKPARNDLRLHRNSKRTQVAKDVDYSFFDG